jgi:integrase/recombinase XerD
MQLRLILETQQQEKQMTSPIERAHKYPVRNPALVAYAAYLRVEKGLQPLSIEAYRADLTMFAQQLDQSGATLASATRQHVSAFLASLQAQGLSARTASRKLSSLRGFYRWMLRSGHTTADPTLHISSPSGWRVLPKSIAEATISQAFDRLEAAVETAANARSLSGKDRQKERSAQALALRDAAMLEVLYGAGVRVSEAASLTVASVQLAAGHLRVLGKGDKERVVPIGRSAAHAIERYLHQGRPVLATGAAPQPHLFLNALGRPLQRNAILVFVKKAVGPTASPHMLRHSCATHMVNHGADLRTVQTILGHADIGTTEIYTHVAIGRLRQVHRAHHPRERRAAAAAAEPAS